MARFACIRAEVEKRRQEEAMGDNGKIRILDRYRCHGPWSNDASPAIPWITTTLIDPDVRREKSYFLHTHPPYIHIG